MEVNAYYSEFWLKINYFNFELRMLLTRPLTGHGMSRSPVTFGSSTS